MSTHPDFTAPRLIIQIPCYNEAQTLPVTLQALPKQLSGIGALEILVIDDGSQDETALVARQSGAQHVLRLKQHSGLAGAFSAGLQACLELGAEIIVNTDADNQYNAEDLQNLVDPILKQQADIVIGDRGVATLKTFSPSKRFLQRLGSWVVAQTSGLHIPDATSGFRAFSRQAAMRTLVMSDYSYTLETLIQAGANHMQVAYVPVRTNPTTRPSRLIRSVPQYLVYSSGTILRSYAMYRPLRVFTLLGSLLLSGGVLLGLRFLYFYLLGQGGGHIQSVILAAILSIIGFQILMIGLLAELVSFNRRILEEVLYRMRKMEYEGPQEARHASDERANDL